MQKVERQLQLVALLVTSRDPLTFEQIQQRFEDAYVHEDIDSAKRMFERDKDELRGMGVPIEMAPIEPLGPDEGYTIPAERYYLPEISFTEQEASALMILAAVPDEEDPAVQGIRKLIYGAEGGPLPLNGSLVIGGTGTSGALAQLWNAMHEQRAVGFEYRTAQGKATQRQVDPYALVTRAGRWYVVARDREQDQIRAFRLSRMTSALTVLEDEVVPAPAGLRAAEQVTGPWDEEIEARETARVAVADRVAWWAIRGLAGASIVAEGDAGWVEVQAPLNDALGPWVLSLGADAEALSPPALRADVQRHLEALAAGG